VKLTLTPEEEKEIREKKLKAEEKQTMKE